MSVVLQSLLSKIYNKSYQLKQFHNSSVYLRINYFNAKWREENKLPRNKNSFGPLTNLADYSFKDGRPVPFGTNQKRRIDKQHEYLLKIRKLTGEIDYAVERHRQLQEDVKKKNQQIIDNKFKEKGKKLLTSNNEKC